FSKDVVENGERLGDSVPGGRCGCCGRTTPRRSNVTVQRMDHVGIVVGDLAAATAFFVELGLDVEGEATVEGRVVDRINGLEGVRADIAMMRTPDGHRRLELITYQTPPGP